MSISSDTGPRFWVLPLRHVLLEKIENGRQQACLSTCSTDLTVPAGKLHQSFIRVVYYGGQGWVWDGGGILFDFLELDFEVPKSSVFFLLLLSRNFDDQLS